MKLLLLLLLGVISVSGLRRTHKCLRRREKPVEFLLDESHRPENKYKGKTLPSSLDWRWKNGQRYVTWTRNQHIPNYCGSCWAMATTSALADRLMILHNNSFSEYNLAPQVLLDCDMVDDGCHGGDPNVAFEYIRTNGITSETCAPYEAVGHDTGRKCTQESICKNCQPGSTGCFAQYPYRLYKVTEHGSMSGVTAMMQSLQDGPIVCGMAVTQAFENYRGFGIFNDTTGDKDQDHAISLVGYGTDPTSGVDYWIGRNSWGTWWGEDGYFRIVRGTDNMGIEDACDWGNPAEPVWVNSSSKDTGEIYKKKPEQQDVVLPVKRKFEACRPPKNDWITYPPKITTPEPKDYIDPSALPNKWDWNDINGINYLTTSRNQHIPQYCGSCWAFGTTSSLCDRLNVQRGYQNKQSLWPEINFAPQVLINEDGGGTCNGGSAPGAMRYIERSGIPDETCQAYQAKNNPHGHNTNLNICENCVPGSQNLTPGTCSKVTNFTLYHVTQYGPVSGVNSMKSEIYARGPIACGIDADAQLEAYKGGVFSQDKLVVTLNHEVSIVGWGVTSQGENYWVVRNSWGAYWGESQGFFRIKMGSENLGIERDCTWGVPKMPTSS